MGPDDSHTLANSQDRRRQKESRQSLDRDPLDLARQNKHGKQPESDTHPKGLPRHRSHHKTTGPGPTDQQEDAQASTHSPGPTISPFAWGTSVSMSADTSS